MMMDLYGQTNEAIFAIIRVYCERNREYSSLKYKVLEVYCLSPKFPWPLPLGTMSSDF
jgi:hypothetical protein